MVWELVGNIAGSMVQHWKLGGLISPQVKKEKLKPITDCWGAFAEIVWKDSVEVDILIENVFSK